MQRCVGLGTYHPQNTKTLQGISYQLANCLCNSKYLSCFSYINEVVCFSESNNYTQECTRHVIVRAQKLQLQCRWDFHYREVPQLMLKKKQCHKEMITTFMHNGMDRCTCMLQKLNNTISLSQLHNVKVIIVLLHACEIQLSIV